MPMGNFPETAPRRDCTEYRAALERHCREADRLRAVVARLLDHVPDDLPEVDEARRLLE